MNRYFDCAELSDITIRFGSDIIRGHKIVLAQGSTWFSRAFEGGFQEATAAELELFEDDPIAVKGMVAYLYGLHYYHHNGPLPKLRRLSDVTPFVQHRIKCLLYFVDLWVVADKYGVTSLADSILEDLRGPHWNTSWMYDNLVDTDRRTEFDFMVRTIYEKEDSAAATIVKQYICTTIARHQKERMAQSDRVEWSGFVAQLIRDILGLAVEMGPESRKYLVSPTPSTIKEEGVLSGSNVNARSEGSEPTKCGAEVVKGAEEKRGFTRGRLVPKLANLMGEVKRLL